MVIRRWAPLLALVVAACSTAAPTRAVPQHVVWVGAHPDDEIFASPLLKELCVEGSASCMWIVLTRGERGVCREATGCHDLVRLRSAELRQSAVALHATAEQWELADGTALDPLDVVRGWASGDCRSLVRRLRAALASADIVLTFDSAHGTSLHPDHRAAAILVATAIAGMSRPPLLFAVLNRAEVTRGGTLVEFAPAPTGPEGALVSDVRSWPAVVGVARNHRTQFDREAISRLGATAAEARIIVAAPVTARPPIWCATP
jgi:LmbE family N-acetylglucosaminyl deacetylase